MDRKLEELISIYESEQLAEFRRRVKEMGKANRIQFIIYLNCNYRNDLGTRLVKFIGGCINE